MKIIVFGCLLILNLLTLPSAQAIVDPLASPNNKFGIHIISSTPDEASPAADLVNSTGGDWGYVTVLIESKDRNKEKWQTFFNELRRRHLVPLVRLATQPEGSVWKIPYEGEEIAWADFLDSLIWPTKNRYIIIYNEPNQGQEWAGKVDSRSYAKVLDKTITALKSKNPDFFVLNAGFDASAPPKAPLFEDEERFLTEMNQEIPGIFNRLDGWVSHSYPNPGFVGSPSGTGKGTVGTWAWELQLLRGLGVSKNLPVFITETGWKHSEGKTYDKSLPGSETVAKYFQQSFSNSWSYSNIVAITPFLLNYQDYPFDHFSFKKIDGTTSNSKILGASFPGYYPHYQTILEMPKNKGLPKQEMKAELVSGTIYPMVVSNENYTIPLVFKNTGQSIWNDQGQVELKAVLGGKELGINSVKLTLETRVEPGQEATFKLQLHSPLSGTFPVKLQLFSGEEVFDQPPLNFSTQVQSPLSLLVSASLGWKNSFEGLYTLEIDSDYLKTKKEVKLDALGRSESFLASYLLPDHSFIFTLSKSHYKPKTIQLVLKPGTNFLSFGSLEPDLLSTLLNPQELWRLLPFSN